MVALPIG